MNKTVLAVFIFVFACGLAGAQKLTGSKWLLASIDDLDSGISKDIGALTKATLSFDSDSTYSGKFCNTFSGHLKCKENLLKMGIPSHTKLKCLGLDKYETEMFEILPLSVKYRIDKETLFIFTSTHKRLTFKRA